MDGIVESRQSNIYFKHIWYSQAKWYIAITLVLRRQRQNNGKFEAILVYVWSPCFKHKYTNSKSNTRANNTKSMYVKTVSD